MINPSIRTMAAKLCSGIVTRSQCTRNLVRLVWLLLIAGLLPVIAAAQTAPTAPTAQTFTVTPTTITESSTPTQMTATVTLTDGTFSVARLFQISSINGTARHGTDFTVLPYTTLTVPANTATGTLTFSFTATVDEVVEAGGETVFFQSNFLTVTEKIDSSIPHQRATVTINDPPPTAAPTFDNMAMFTTAISVPENTTAAGTANFFAASGGGNITYMLGGTDAARFTITDGTLTFMAAPDFEMPRGMALSTTNTNDYALTMTAMNSLGTAESGAITVRVTDANEAPVLATIPTPAFTEHTAGGFTITATDEDAGQMLTFSLTGEAHGATLTDAGVFSWMPGEEDGGVERTFTITVTDDGTPPMSASIDFVVIAVEVNEAPTGATITGTATLTAPQSVTLMATATDPDGNPLAYTWSLLMTGDGSIVPTAMMSSEATYTPPTGLTATRTITVTVTVSDGTLTTTAMHEITVNPPVAAGTAPVFTNMAMFTTAIEVAENTTAAGLSDFFAAPGSGTVTLTLGGTDAALFSITDAGTLTFNAAPDFEMPRGMDLSGTNTNNYALTVTATGDTDPAAMSGPITVTVTDVNETPDVPTWTFTTTSTSITVTWEAPANTGPPITEYQVGYQRVGAATISYGSPPALSDRSFTITGLMPATQYDVFVTAANGEGTTSESATMRVTTAAPPLPTGITLTLNPTMVTESATATEITATATLVGGTFTTERVVTFASGTQGTATVGTDYSPVLRTNIIIPANMPSASVIFSFRAHVDSDTDSGETVVFESGVFASGNSGPLDGAVPGSTATLTIIDSGVDTAPAFASGATIPNQTYTQDTAIETLTLPEATGGDGTITYVLTPAPPAGLTFDAATRELSGTPTAVATAADYTYTAADADDNMAADDAATLTFTITVNPMVLGIDDLTDRTFNIYPNPVSGSLTVERKGIATDEISIHDLTGKRIHVPVREQSPRKVVLDVSGLAGGMYLVKVSGSGSTVRRLIVEHRQ